MRSQRMKAAVDHPAEPRNVDAVKHFDRKLAEKGVQRLERRPADGLPLKHDPKKGHGGKYTWEGPSGYDYAALDGKDPNYEEDEDAGAGEEGLSTL